VTYYCHITHGQRSATLPIQVGGKGCVVGDGESPTEAAACEFVRQLCSTDEYWQPVFCTPDGAWVTVKLSIMRKTAVRVRARITVAFEVVR
jgi:hypothetical protein